MTQYGEECRHRNTEELALLQWVQTGLLGRSAGSPGMAAMSAVRIGNQPVTSPKQPSVQQPAHDQPKPSWEWTKKVPASEMVWDYSRGPRPVAAWSVHMWMDHGMGQDRGWPLPLLVASRVHGVAWVWGGRVPTPRAPGATQFRPLSEHSHELLLYLQMALLSRHLSHGKMKFLFRCYSEL